MPFKPGLSNLITDVDGLLVGNTCDPVLKSGTTVVSFPESVTASYSLLGGAPGTRETDLLEPHNSVQRIDALVLSGGSAFGLDAASGVQAALREQGRGFLVRGHRVPIVPSAILADLANGGEKGWGRYPPYRELGYAALQDARKDFGLGSTGAGIGALCCDLKGGLGSASTLLENGFTVGALAVANPAGCVTVGGTRHFWAAPFEIGDEFGGLGLPRPLPPGAMDVRWKYGGPDSGGNTTIGVIATDAVLTKADAKRLAIAAQDGLARAIWPTHTPADGDLVFAVATGTSGRTPTYRESLDLFAVAGATMARAIARGVYHASPGTSDVYPAWSELTA